MAITADDVLHLAKLARLDLTDAEVERFTPQLAAILEYVGQLREVEVDVAREAVANITGLENVMRDDELRACTPEERAAVIEQFPMREGDLLKTKGVFGT